MTAGYRRLAALIMAVGVMLGLIVGTTTTSLQSARADDPPTYTNPVSSSFADTYADPTVLLAQDGWYYSYATADPLYADSHYGVGHIARTRDWVEWEYVGEIFTDENRPIWADEDSFLWAPDIRYIDGQYIMYFTVTTTTLTDSSWDPAIGVATSADPGGPFVPEAEPLIEPILMPDGNEYRHTIDPTGFTDLAGNHYLYWGNYVGGMYGIELDETGMRAVGEETLVGAWDRYEAPYVFYHDGYYYMTASSANCCAGPATGYSVFVARSESPMGPFLDADGRDMTASVTGGTILLTQNGNRWIGAGHHSIFTDSQGRDWISYHAIDRFDPWLNEPGGINRRPMLIDWIDGWPSVRGGAGPSEGAQPAPAVESLLSATAWAPADGFENMSAATDPQGGDVGRVSGLSVSREDLPQGNIRVAFDVLLGEESFRAEIGSGLSVRLDPETASFTVTAPGVDEQVGLRATDGWRRVVVTVRGGNIEAEVSEGGLKAPSSWISVAAPGLDRDAEPLRLEGNALVDNLWVQNPAVGLSEHVAVPEPGEELWRDGFADQLDERWSWVREQDDVTVDDGLHWPLRDADLVGDNNSAAVLLTDPGSDDDWIIETEFTLDLGEDDIRNHQQAGLIAYRNDEDFARLSSVAIWRTRTVEYGREVAVRPGDDRTIYGGAIIGASAPTMRMRLAYHQNDAGEHLYRAGISTDTGQSWIWGAVWTFSAGEQPRVGLYTGGGTHHDAVASFHYVSKSEATWPTGDGSLPAPSPSPSEPPSQSPSESPEPTESPVPRPSTPGKRPGLPEAGS